MQKWQCPISIGTLKSFFSIKYELDIHVFASLTCLFSFAVSLHKWLAHFMFIRSNGETHNNKHILVRKRKSSSIFLIRLRVLPYTLFLWVIKLTLKIGKKSSWINKNLKFQCVDPYPLDQQDFGILDPD